MGRKRGNVEDELNPDITPLIDILFILLIFFMVSSVFKKEEVALLLTLPKSDSTQTNNTKTKTIYILVNTKKMLVNKQEMSIIQFEEYVKTVGRKDIPVDLKIDKDVKYSRVVQLMDILQKNGLNNLAFITDQK
jgi:biopolymer transport protein ExbD